MEIIFKTIVGSKMHGLSTPDSDEDVRYITRRSLRDILSPFKNEEVKVGNGEDVESWELRHFVKHLTSGNPTIYEVINSPLYDKSFPDSDAIRALMPHAFDAKRVLNAHIGYAEAQLKRYLRKAFHDLDRTYGERISNDIPLLNSIKYELADNNFPKMVGVWEENHVRRIPKSVVAAYRVLAQGKQLLSTGTFEPIIANYSQELHDNLMSIKLMDANTIDFGFVDKHLRTIEQGIQELNQFFDALPESRREAKPNISALEDALATLYKVE